MTVLLIGLGAPLGLLLGLFAVPVVVLFLLKRRHQDLPVSSTLLWAAVLEDLRARAPFRRPTEWLSLILLLFAIAAAALAAAGLRLGKAPRGRRAVVLVLDTSASMATVDKGTSRFARARSAAVRTIEGLSDFDPVTIIAASGQARFAGHRTEDHAAQQEVLDSLAVEAVEGDLLPSLAAAVREAEANPGEAGAEVIVFSDFAVDGDRLASLDSRGVSVTLVKCGEERPNAGIVHAAVSSEAEGGRLLVTVAGKGESPLLRTLSLYREDELVDARGLSIEPGRESSEAFDVTADDPSTSVRYRAVLTPADDLPLDDEVCAGVARNPPPRLLVVGPEDPFLARLPQVFPGLELERVEAADLPGFAAGVARPFDLSVFTDGPPPSAAVPATRELYFGVAPEGLGVSLGVPAAEPVVLSWRRGHPLLRSVGFENLLLVRSRRLELPDAAEVLLETGVGAQLALVESQERSALVWASTLEETNLALLPAFPLLVRNLLGQSLGGVNGDLDGSREPLRRPAGLLLQMGEVEVEMTSPSGESRTATLWSREDFAWPGGVELGFYTMTARGESETVTRHLGQNLFSRLETTAPLAEPDAGAFSGEEVRSIPLDELETERPVWRWLVALAVFLLSLEALIWSGVLARSRSRAA